MPEQQMIDEEASKKERATRACQNLLMNIRLLSCLPAKQFSTIHHASVQNQRKYVVIGSNELFYILELVKLTLQSMMMYYQFPLAISCINDQK